MDSKTIAIWGDAMCAALHGDRRELVAMLRHDNEVTPDLAEFLAWLLDEKRKSGRPPLPAKFRVLKQMQHPLFDAAFDFWQVQSAWKAAHPRRQFPYEKTLDEVAAKNRVDPNRLHTYLQRSRKIRG